MYVLCIQLENRLLLKSFQSQQDTTHNRKHVKNTEKQQQQQTM